MQLELKTSTLSVHSNLGSITHVHIRLLMANAQYALISNSTYVRPVYPVIIHIPNNATWVAADVLKFSVDKNIRVFQEVRGVEQAIIQQIVAAVEENT